MKEQGKALIGAAAELEGQLIAAQTQMEGLRQIYTDNNVRVRTLQARIAEYKRQLQKLDGNNVPAADGSSAGDQAQDGQAQELYPSIRRLPTLGVTYADLYRRTRVEEVVFETLTKQFEIAKVEEARETPSVKVLDTADVPERKSFPPRMLLVLWAPCWCWLLAAVGSWLGTLAGSRSGDPRKVLALDVIQTYKRHHGFRDPWISSRTVLPTIFTRETGGPSQKRNRQIKARNDSAK